VKTITTEGIFAQLKRSARRFILFEAQMPPRVRRKKIYFYFYSISFKGRETIIMITPLKKSSIYTKTGDRGETTLYTGERCQKDDLIFDALGTVDELNSQIGVANEFCKKAENGLQGYLEEIQSRLLDIGSSIATPASSASEAKLTRVAFDAAHTETLESWIDLLDCQLPKLTRFILPSGGFSSSFLHVARSVCRRAERLVVGLMHQDRVDPSVAVYLNRLSDFLFVAARFAAMKDGQTEITYKKGEGPQTRQTTPTDSKSE
jgi:cob(I)alamin adenosyltransferase